MTGNNSSRAIVVGEMVASSAWLGAALLVVTVVAPVAFAALPTRTLAGQLVGAVLPPLFYAGIVIGSLVVAASVTTRHGGIVTLGTVGGFLVAVSCAGAQFAVAPRIERTRASIGGPVEALAASDPRRLAFGHLHGASVLLLGVAMLGAATVTGAAAATLRRTR